MADFGGNNSTGQNIRTADRHCTGISEKSGQKRDVDRTQTVLSVDVLFRDGLYLNANNDKTGYYSVVCKQCILLLSIRTSVFDSL